MTFSSLKQRIDRHRAYSRTRRELRALPLHVRLDLDIGGVPPRPPGHGRARGPGGAPRRLSAGRLTYSVPRLTLHENHHVTL